MRAFPSNRNCLLVSLGTGILGLGLSILAFRAGGSLGVLATMMAIGILGALAVWLLVVRPLGERMAFERSRAESIIAASPDAIVIGDHRGRVELVNPAAVRVFGWSPEEIVGRPFETFIAAEAERSEQRRRFEAQMRDPAAHFPLTLSEIPSLRKDGSVFMADVSANVFPSRAGFKTVTIVRDVTERRRLEELRAAEERRFRHLIEHSTEIIGLLGHDQTVRYASPAFQRVMGHAGDDWTGREFTSLIIPEDLEKAVGLFREAIAHPGQPVPWLLRLVHADGTHRWLEGTSTSLSGDQGEEGVVVNAHDVTERLAAESRLIQLSRAVEQSPASIVITDLEGRIEYVNPKFCAVTGYGADEVRGANPRVLKSGETPPEAYRELWRTISSGGEWRGEFHNRKRNGGLYWESATISPIFDGAGKATHYLAVKEDITARKAAEGALRESEERFASAFRHAPVGMALVMPDGRLLRVNDALGRLLGFSAEQLMARSLHDLTHPDDLDLQQAQMAELLAGRIETSSIEERLIHRCGEEVWVQVNAFLVREGNGQPLYYIHQIQDITSRKSAQETLALWAGELAATNKELQRERRERAQVEAELHLAQKLEAIGHLAAGIAHEINTPIQFVGDSARFLQTSLGGVLQAMDAYGEVLEALKTVPGHEATLARLERVRDEADLDFVREEVPAALERVFDGVQRVTSIVRAMKEFAHPSRAEVVAADLNHMLRTTLTVARNEYKHVAEVVTEFGELPFVPCNVGEMNQVFLNLIVNSAQAIGEVVAGTDRLGRIEVRTATDGDEVVVQISDTGGGIPDAIRDRVFEPFFTTKPTGKGTGQGLAIARSIVVDRHRGAVSFVSRPGEGTTFTIRIPTTVQSLTREVAA